MSKSTIIIRLYFVWFFFKLLWKELPHMYGQLNCTDIIYLFSLVIAASIFQIWYPVSVVYHHLILVKNSFTCVTCERVRDCRAWRGLAMQYCINTSLVFAASFIWVSHSSPNVKLVLRAFILSNWTFNQSCSNWHYFKMYV